MILRGPILIPQRDGRVQFLPDGIISGASRIEWIGDAASCPFHSRAERSRGVIVPPFFDNHIHIPQHPIRGHFMDGVESNAPNGRLIAGLNRNVFPAESKCADRAYTEATAREFLRDTLSKGVIGGAAYMTVHPAAARIALEILPATWSVGMVAMNQNCPEYLRNDESTFDADCEALARDFGRRFIATDRFAVSTTTDLRKRVVQVAKQFVLRTQTHLNEQLAEKKFVEETLYPGQSYTQVYRDDGLLDHSCILAHCIWMTDAELDTLAETKSCIAHCPVSNTLLGSGIMPLDRVVERGVDYAICTDVGASPTTSLLNEMAQYLKVHEGRSQRATPSEALYRTTLGAARMLREDASGELKVGETMSFVEIGVPSAEHENADEMIRAMLRMESTAPLSQALSELATGRIDAGLALDLLEDDVKRTAAHLESAVQRVTIDGSVRMTRDG